MSAADAALRSMRESGDRLMAVLADAYELQARKATDYNRTMPRDAYFPLGTASYVQMIWVKALRLASLASVPGVAPANEALGDTALDLVNYAAFLAEWLARKEEKS